ncbi:unnamed protein product [Paramecium octaurelia]|uniref:Uncharacterized protein n=1 Tax=Paramecium octaurelia TaxID=43137 RepID=A0A8S1VE56_PAROT|nr:unnamed protein product [Paramecium octaurelia]
MSTTIVDLFTQIKQLHPQQNLAEFHQKFKDDDEYKNIVKQNNNTKSNFDTTEDRQTLINQLTNIINDVKIAHKESLLSAKQFEISSAEKQKALNENANLKKQIGDFEVYRNVQHVQQEYLKEYYNIVIQKENEKSQDFIEGIQQEFEEIQTKLDNALIAKQKNEKENQVLKEKFKDKKSYVEQRNLYFDQEIKKMESLRKEKYTQMFEQINILNKSLHSELDESGKLESLRKDVALIDKHLNPHLQKESEYNQLIEKTNQLINLYNSEAERLLQQIQDYQQKIQSNQRISEQSGPFIYTQALEYKRLLQKLQQEQEKRQSLQTLKSVLQNQLK